MNANVEFNVKTLMPTYRLQWGAAGESQALAVAEGLGFDPDIVEAAHKIANQATFMSKPGKPRWDGVLVCCPRTLQTML